jgi:uncharacterized protein (DUF2164 family)
MPITISPEAKVLIVASIKRYVAENLEQDIGDLKAGSLLDYFLKEIGPTVYNRAIADAQEYFQARALDLEGVCFEREFGYWTDTAPRGARGQRAD